MNATIVAGYFVSVELVGAEGSGTSSVIPSSPSKAGWPRDTGCDDRSMEARWDLPSAFRVAAVGKGSCVQPKLMLHRRNAILMLAHAAPLRTTDSSF